MPEIAAAAHRPPWLALALALVTAAGALGAASRDPAARLELASESAWSGFGSLIAADGEVLVARDLSAEDEWSPVVRIVTVREARVVDDTRLPYRRGDWPIALDVSQGRVVVQLDSKRLDFYERRDHRWTRVHSLELAGRCRESFQFLDLAGTVLVLGASEAICVYELRGDSWILTAQLSTVSGLDDPRTNGDRIAQHAVRPDSIRLTRRPRGLWETERTLRPPARCRIEAFAISPRWLAVTTTDTRDDSREIQLYSLGATVELTAVLRPQADDLLFGYQLALTDDHLLATGFSHQLFSARGGSWHPEGVLAPSLYPDRAVLGSLAWIGVPGDDEPGVITGYRLDSPGDPR